MKRNMYYEKLYQSALKKQQNLCKCVDVSVQYPTHNRRDWYATFIKQYATGVQEQTLADGTVAISFLDKYREYVGGYVVPNYVVLDVIESILG